MKRRRRRNPGVVTMPKKLQPSTVYHLIRLRNGVAADIIAAPYDGTDADAQKVAQALANLAYDQYYNSYHDDTYSSIDSQTFASDAAGNPKWVISPNGRLSAAGTADARYALGDLSAAPKKKGRKNPPGVDEKILYKGGAKTVCTSHVLNAFGIDACQYHYSGQVHQITGILRRHGFAVRSRKSHLRKHTTVGAAREIISDLGDPAGTKYVLVLAYGTMRHAILIGQSGETLVDTAPREADRRRITHIYAVYQVVR